MNKEELLNRLLKHKEHITTVRKYDAYAKEQQLPSAQSLISTFGSWKCVKDELGIIQIDRKKELLTIASKHKLEFTTVEHWNEYAKEQKLPTGYTYISYFGSWNGVKEILDLSPSLPYPSKEDKKQEMIQVLKEHGSNYKNRTEWDLYAKEHNLPTYKTIRNYLTFEEVKEQIPKEIKYSYTQKELIQIARKHIEHFSSMGKWNNYAKEHGLPNSATFHRKFGSWKKAKVEVLKYL